MSVVGDTINQNIGNVEKAIIEIIDLRNRATVVKDSVRVANSVGGMDSSATVGGNMAGNVNTKAYTNKGLINDVISDELNGQGNIQDENLKALSGGKRKLFRVQFNPASLSLTGHSGGLVKQSDFGKGSPPQPPAGGQGQQGQPPPPDPDDLNELGYVPANTDIIMSVSLLFDRVDPADSFAGDKFNLSLTGVGTNIAKAGMSIYNTKKGTKRYTVQNQVEGFIAALRNKNTRIITFHWGEFNYSGVLRSVSATYTMFNPVGAPVRATVDLSILCADKEMYPNSLAVWQERYKKAFQKRGTEEHYSYVRTEQKVGSLLNL
ncbi:MAG: hypothetical protein IJP84_11850 [Lachnospiraceae bacterium]|nr:hypothetical protein [Lachnospiraceae bacterium]